MTGLLQNLFAGVSLGATYALIALGFVILTLPVGLLLGWVAKRAAVIR